MRVLELPLFDTTLFHNGHLDPPYLSSILRRFLMQRCFLLSFPIYRLSGFAGIESEHPDCHQENLYETNQ